MIQALEQHQLYGMVHEYQQHAEKMQPLIIPVINLNGTAGAELVEQLRKVMDMLHNADEVMSAATPHGRDFQTIPGGEQLAHHARDGWRQRRNMLAILKQDIELLALAISKQGRR